MWKYTEPNAYDSISLHDCRANKIEVHGNDLYFCFPDGFWIAPVSNHNEHDKPLRTGPSQVRCHAVDGFALFDSIDIFKPIRLFGKTIFWRRIQPELDKFLKIIHDQNQEIEFISEYHSGYSALYECCIWNKNCAIRPECQLKMGVKSIEYCWNEILPDREW